jgi:cytochrome P450
MSNLFAAMGWTLVHLLERPALLERVRAEEPGLLSSCAHESIRLMQRSVVLRKVLQPTVLRDEHREFAVSPGIFLATLMSSTNRSAAPGLDDYDPAHYERRRFTRRGDIATPELVTTFGHGAHSCPAQTFSIRSIEIAVTTLVQRFELTPRFHEPGPLRHQVGGVARADRTCRVDYRLRVTD